MKKAILAAMLTLSFPVYSGGLLGDAAIDLKSISSDTYKFDPKLSKQVMLANDKIERAAIAQALQEDSLTKKIKELEQKIETQDKIISNYEKLVAELESKIPKDSK